MLKKVNNYIYSSIFTSIIFIILGIICIMKPDISFSVISNILIVIFLLNGIALLIIDYQVKFIFLNNFLYGILSLVIGIILLVHPDTLKVILPSIIGIWFMISGLLSFRLCIYLKNESVTHMIITIIMSLISIICGITLMMRPTESTNILTMTLGITFIIHSISNMIDMCIIHKHINKIVKNIKHYISEVKVIDEE